MSFWEYCAAVDGFNKANTPPDAEDKSLSDDEYAELSDMLDGRG